jgi:hypothetical protein
MATFPLRGQHKAAAAVQRATDYLTECGIHVPAFALTTEWTQRLGGSYVSTQGKAARLNMGRYPGEFIRDWFAMHELGHILWAYHRPDRRRAFRKAFGDPLPDDYDQVHHQESWKTVMSWKLSWFHGPHRPEGEPSWYGARAGGEERFCELIALMYAHGDFSMLPPPDLSGLWGMCWVHGLSAMT